MNFFSSEAFLGAIAASYFKRRSCRIVLSEVEGRVFRVLRVGRMRVVHDVRFMDYLEPVPMSGASEPVPRARFLRRVCHGVVPVERFERTQGMMPAPLVRWEGFPTFADFEAHVESRSKSVFKTTARKARKLSREIGPLRFEYGLSDDKVLMRIFEWKSEQYRRSGLPDLFAAPAIRALFRTLLRARAVEMSGLYAGERLVAAHVGPRHEGRFYHWVPTYDPDPALAKYSPGHILNHELMRRSHAERDHTFDLLLGGEPYKWRYTTHVACVGPLGGAPLVQRALERVREAAAAPVRRLPALEGALRAAKRTLEERELLL